MLLLLLTADSDVEAARAGLLASAPFSAPASGAAAAAATAAVVEAAAAGGGGVAGAGGGALKSCPPAWWKSARSPDAELGSFCLQR